MGLRGPAPKPTALKVLEGNPGHRPLNKAEPKPDRTMPQCPAWLRPEAKAEWRRVAGKLHKAGILTSVDRAVLALYCQAWARWREAEEMIEASSQVIKSTKGGVYMNPWLSAAQAASKDVSACAAKLGMSPADRTRLSSADGQQDEPTLAEALFGDGL
ncbi:phage terminase small subunit P27 family [Casimicrobium huifangae]|uniref:phage terminase small subunit P27 family n=1 Tax=Casimicrobium huifangae TaxID=2591109 RepID=UPI0037847724